MKFFMFLFLGIRDMIIVKMNPTTGRKLKNTNQKYLDVDTGLYSLGQASILACSSAAFSWFLAFLASSFCAFLAAAAASFSAFLAAAAASFSAFLAAAAASFSAFLGSTAAVQRQRQEQQQAWERER